LSLCFSRGLVWRIVRRGLAKERKRCRQLHGLAVSLVEMITDVGIVGRAKRRPSIASALD
jgi:hypothetical protein